MIQPDDTAHQSRGWLLFKRVIRALLGFLGNLMRPAPGSRYADFDRHTKTGKVRAKSDGGDRQRGAGPDMGIYRLPGVSDSARKVYVYLSASADADGYCFPFYRTIAKRTGLSPSAVGKAIKELEKRGFVTHQQRVSRRGGSSNLYHVRRVSAPPGDDRP